MKERAETAGGGFSVLDGVALVTGAAVASVHLRGIIRETLSGFGWALVWATFAWITLTAAGPFVFLVRRFARRIPDYPQVGDRLWGALGLPWLATAILNSAAAGPGPQGAMNDLTALSLSVGLTASCLIALIVVWRQWVMVPSERASEAASPPWTNRVGLALSVAWPIQCGLGLVVLG